MDRLPPTLYHATPPENVQVILRQGLVPQDESYVVGPDGVHLDRVFLSRFDDPWYMNLPAGKMEGAVVLAVDTSYLDRSRLYPDDTLYGAYFNDKLEDYELGAMFPDHYRRWGSSGSTTGFGDWMDDNGPSDAEVEGILAGRFGLTLWNSGDMHGYNAEMGEVGYDGRIPPEAVSLHAPAAALRSAALRVAGQHLYHCTLADNLLDIAREGLDPARGGANFSGGPDDPSGWVEGKLFLSDDPQKALYYGENAMAKLWGSRKTPPVLLRVPRSAVRAESDRYGDFWTEDAIPPSLIEAKAPVSMEPGSPWEWEALTEELAEEARDAFSGDYLGRDEPLFLAPDFSSKASGYGVEIGPNEHGGVSASVVDPDGEQVDDAYGDLHVGTAGEFHDSGEYFDPDDEPIHEEGTVAVLTGMELPEEMRGLGIGRRMVEELVGWAFSNGAEAVYTHAMGAPGDPDPAGFYEKLGFEEVGSSFMGTYMRLGNPSLREAAREPAFLKRLRDADALPTPAVSSDAISSVMGGTLIHHAAGSTGTPGGDLSGKMQSILDNGLDPAYWAKPWAGSPGEGHPQAVYLSLAWDAILDDPPPNYVLVEPRLSNPLVLRAGDADGNYMWGPALNEATGKSGAGLSSFLRSKGYDSIITVHKYGVGEVAYFGKEPLPATLPTESDRTAHILGAAADIVRRVAAVEDIYRGVKTVVEKYKGRGLFARFSDVPKIGIRPSTEHHDPYGVYFYPVDWLAENAGFGTTYVNLPYITVARVRRSGWLNLATVRPARARELAEKGGVLEEYEARTEGKGLNQARGGRAGKRLWDAVEAKVKPFESEANKMEWNRIFGRMGVKAIYDPGTGSVNTAEPSQIVVLDLSLIEVVDVVENKEDRKSVFHAVLKAVADEVLDDGWRVSGSHAEGGISADGTVGGQPVAMSVLPAKAGFEMEVALSYHDSSGKKQRIVSRGRMPNEWEDAPADYLSEVHAKSILRSLGEADIGAGGEEDAEDMLDGALRALTELRLPDLTVEEGEGGVEFWKNTGDGKIGGSLKVSDGRRELELYAEDWLLSGGEDSTVIEIGPMRVSWEGDDPSSASADMAAELSRAVRELRVTDDDGKPREVADRGAAAEIARTRTLNWMFPDDILQAAGQKYERKKTASECPHGDYRSYSCSPGGVRMPPRVTPDIHDAVSSLFGGDCTCPRCQAGDRAASSVEERCWVHAAEALAASGFSDMNGMCLEASVVLCERLRDEGVGAKLVRRWSDDHGGHWTVRTPAGEFDPTIAWWGDSVPEGAERGRLYEVGDGSPHAGWDEDAAVDEAAAYRIAREELGVEDFEDLYDNALERSFACGARRVAMPYLHEPRCPRCGHVGPKDPKVEFWASLPGDYREFLHRHYGTDDRREIARRLMWDRAIPTYCGGCGEVYLFEKEPAAKVAGQFKAWHGTSTAHLDEIREAGGLADPYLAATPSLARYYAEVAAEDDGGEEVLLEVDIRDRSRLRYDGNAMDEPVTVGVSEDDRNLEWGRAEKEHPEWVHGDMISIPPEEWEYSWRGAHSVRYEGLLPLTDIGGDINVTASVTTTFNGLPESVRADIAENLHDAFFGGTDVSHEVLREVLVDMDTPLAARRLPVADLAEQARARHSASGAAVTGLMDALRRVGELDPVLTDGDRLHDGGHRVLAYEAEGRDTIPTVDISPLLSADWETEFNEEIPGLAKDPDPTGPRVATALRAASDAIAARTAEPTPGNIEAARLFVLRKWRERASEMGRPEPEDAAGACKFASMFAQRVFGADIRGNSDHQYAELPGVVIDLAPGGERRHDREWFGNPDHAESMDSCEPRVARWESEFRAENPAMFGAPMRVWRAEGAGRGVMADAIPGGMYFFPRRETAELWAGERGTVVERIVDTAGASVQDVPEGEMVRGAEGAIIRRDPDGSGEVLEVVVFDDSLIRTASVAWYGSAPPLVYGEFLDPVAASLSRAARAVGEHLGDTVTAYRALGAEHAEKVMREGFTGPHHAHGVYYTASRERAMFYARFMASSRLQGVIFELEADTSRSTADVNDTTEWQSNELFEEVRRAAGDMVEAVRQNADVRLWDTDAARQLESWLGGLTVSEGFYESPAQHSVWQLLADETEGTDGEMTIADAREALPPGRYGETTVLDSRGVAGIDAGEMEGQAQAVSDRGVPADRLRAVWLPTSLLDAAGEDPPPGAETMGDHVDVIPAKFDADYDIDFVSEIERQRDEAREGYESDPPEGMSGADEAAYYDGLEEVADEMDGILGRWRDEGDSTMPGHIYSKLAGGERVTPEDLDREEGFVRYPLPEGRLAATKALRKAIAASEPGQGRRPKLVAASERVDMTDDAIARALRRAAEGIGWSEESDVDPESFVDEGFVEDESGQAFWGSQGSGCLFVRNHPKDGQQLLLVKRSPSVEEPNTWGTTGGAVPKGESNLFASAVRETREEIGSIPPYEAVRQYVWKAPGGSFTYTTFILECTDMDWLPAAFNWEATDARWASLEEAASYDLHFGLSAILVDLGKSVFPATEGSDE